MIIIGEKINGAIPSVAAAIERRDAPFIQSLALRQSEAGANYLDVCAGTKTELEHDALCWLIDTVQEVTDTPICIDSPDPALIVKLLPRIHRPGIVNSVSGEGSKCDILFPVIRDNPGWSVVALTCDDDGIPSMADDKVSLALRLIKRAGEYGIAPERLYIDPLVMSLSTVNEAMLTFMEAVERIKEKYPTVKTTSGLSNISYGMPARKIINRIFLSLALRSGMDSAIMDPLDREMLETVMGTEAMLGRDKHCRRYLKAYREGRIGKPKT